MTDQSIQGRTSVGYYDSTYEFDAPKHIDFNTLVNDSDIVNDGADHWFDAVRYSIAGDGEPIVTDDTFNKLISDDIATDVDMTPMHNRAIARRPTTAKRTGRGSTAPSDVIDTHTETPYDIVVDNTQAIQAALNDSHSNIDTTDTLSVPVPSSARRQSRRVSGNKRKTSDVDDTDDTEVRKFPQIEKIDIVHIQPRSAMKFTAKKTNLGQARRISVQNNERKSVRKSISKQDSIQESEPVVPTITEVKRPSTAVSSRLTQATASSTARNSLANSASERRITTSVSRKNSITLDDGATERRTTRSHTRTQSIESHNSSNSQLSATLPSYARPTESARSRQSVQNTPRARSSSIRPSTASKLEEHSAKKQKTITVPISPKFNTASRLSRRPSITKTREEEILEQIETEKLRVKQQLEQNKLTVQHVLQPVDTHVVRSTQQLTQPKEFHLSTEQRAKLHTTDTVEPIQHSVKPKLQYVPGQLTQPKPFKLATEQRIKPNEHILTTEERQLQEIQSHGQFKALEINERVLHSVGDIGVPKVATKEVTKPVEFKLQTDTRLREKPLSTEERELQELGLNKADRRPTTAYRRSSITQPEPFQLSTDERGTHKQAQLEHRLHQQTVLEAQQHEFKAQPMLVVDHPMTIKHEIKVTEPQPFHLKSKQLHQQYQQQHDAQLQQEQQRAEQMRQFKASGIPAAVYDNELVFKPKPADKPLTEVSNVVLHSDERASVRQQYDIELHQKQQQLDEYRALQEAEQAKQEAEQVKALRASQIHHALPVPDTLQHAKFVVQKSNKPLTEPHTPALQTKKRASMVNQR